MRNKAINKIISESIKRVLNEKNQMMNAGIGDMYSNIEKAQNHIKAAMNCFKKVGLYDERRGNSDSYYANIMSSLSNASNMMDRYYWETLEGDEHGIYDNKSADDFKVKQGMKNY